MKVIAFPDCTAELTGDGTVAFSVVILGMPARAEITLEALEDHFGGGGCSAEWLPGLFEANRLEILKVARDRLAARWALGRAILQTDDF